MADPDSLIDKTEKSSTSYTYNNYGQVLTKTTQNASGSQKTVTTNTYVTTEGSKIFGALKSVSDGMGNKTEYYYDSTNGRLLATANVHTSEGSVYTYDSLGRLTGVKPAKYSSSTSYTTETNTERVNYTYNSYGYLSTITTAETTYTLTYDIFGNTVGIKAGSNTLANYDYSSYNGKLKKITYGNEF